jgi:CHAT domain-containing protein/uncharacterized protein HemY
MKFIFSYFRRIFLTSIFRKILLSCIIFTLVLLTNINVYATNRTKFYPINYSQPLLVANQAQIDVLLAQAKALYQAGEFLRATQVWQTVAAHFAAQKDTKNQSLVLSYLALTYQQLGETKKAEASMNQALAKIKNKSDKFIYAQILNNQGQLLINQGKLEKALGSWQHSEKLYRESKDIIGQIGTQINQAQALQSLGMYPRARTILNQVQVDLKNQPDSQLKVNVLLNLGNICRIVGEFNDAQKSFNEALNISYKLKLTSEEKVTLFNLGNLALSQQQFESALNFYQQAASGNSPVELQANIHKLELLVQLKRQSEAEQLLPEIQTQLDNQPLNQASVYAAINLVEAMLKLNENNLSSAAKILASSVQKAKMLGNPRAESYVLGYLGKLYEKSQQWNEAKSVTLQALNLIQGISTDTTYQWQWQMGRLLKATGDIPGAIKNYTAAVDSLQSLRQNLVAVSQDIQFNFREKVEPVYRELVDLLLQDNSKTNSKQIQINIALARQTIEALQLNEIANFFRQACLDIVSRNVEKVDSTAAVIYPIILPNRLEVILSLSGEPLRHYATNLSQEQIENIIFQMRQSLRRTSFAKERLNIAKQIYTLLIEPAIADLTKKQVKTLVFVLDGSLRNIPMAALHDGNNYLIEKFRIAIAPSLQLLNSQPLVRERLKALIGGLSQGSKEFSYLDGVQEEIEQISKTVHSTVLLDKQFTFKALQNKVKNESFSVIHLATHGQFSSKPEDNFILLWDKRLDVQAFNSLLSTRELTDTPPIELLVLSACQTAQGDDRAALGLAGVALRSGARSTVASLWMVNDESTANFMSQFYRELLKQGATKAEALRQAQIYLLRQPEYNHPYYWAPFILVGNWV